MRLHPKAVSILVAVAALTAIAVCVWYPYGFDTTPIADGWAVRERFEAGRLVGPSFTARPFALWSFFAGYWLTPDSFVGLGTIMALAFWGRGLAMFALVLRVAPEDPGLGFLAGALLLVYPADRSAWSLDLIGGYASVLLLLVVANAAVVLWQRESRVALAVAWLCLSVNLLQNEAGYPLVGTAFLVALVLRRQGSELARVRPCPSSPCHAFATRERRRRIYL